LSFKFPKYLLGDLYTISSGLSKKRDEFGYGYPFLTFKEVFNNYFLPDKLLNLANTTAKERITCSIMKGDIFITRTSETQNELGMTSVALKDYPNATFNGFTKRLRVKAENNINIYPKYIGYYMRSPKIRNQINGVSILTTRASLNNSMLQKIEIAVPEYQEQKAIAELLFGLDKKIELNNAINKNLEEMAQALFKRWFIDFEFPNENGEPYKTSGGELEESEVGLIPKGWKVGKIEDLGQVIGGATPSKKEEKYYSDVGIPWITPKDLSNNRNHFVSRGEIDITEEGFKRSSVKLLPKGSILFSSRAPIGYVAIAKNDLTTNQGFKSVIPNIDFGTEFIYYLLKYITPDIENRASGSTFKEISGSEMKKVPVLIPDRDIVQRFNKVMNSVLSKIEQVEEEIANLIEIRDSLLPKLMSGEIRVPVDEHELMSSTE